MNFKNLKPLTIVTRNYTIVAQDEKLLARMRELTLCYNSGMNHELNSFKILSESRPVNAKVILAFNYLKLVGWGLLSNEDSDFYIPQEDGFDSDQGS